MEGERKLGSQIIGVAVAVLLAGAAVVAFIGLRDTPERSTSSSWSATVPDGGASVEVAWEDELVAGGYEVVVTVTGPDGVMTPLCAVGTGGGSAAVTCEVSAEIDGLYLVVAYLIDGGSHREVDRRTFGLWAKGGEFGPSSTHAT